MSALTYRNRLGDLVAVPAVAASDAKNRLGAILDQASSSGPVAITRHDKTRAVLVSIEEFEALVAGREATLETLGAEFEHMLAEMQTPRARKGIASAFASSPVELGRAAVKGAKQSRTSRSSR